MNAEKAQNLFWNHEAHRKERKGRKDYCCAALRSLRTLR
jgi:hypothetical protein